MVDLDTHDFEFDPEALAEVSALVGDGSYYDENLPDAPKRILESETIRRLASLSLAARVVALASASDPKLDDSTVIESMVKVLTRLSHMRARALTLLGADASSAIYPVIYSGVTDAVMAIFTEERKWEHFLGDSVKELPYEIVARLFTSTIINNLDASFADLPGMHLSDIRRLCVLGVIPKVYGLVNIFSYYQKDPERFVVEIVKSVIQQSEILADIFISEESNDADLCALYMRFCTISMDLMEEIFRKHSRADISSLMALSSIDLELKKAEFLECDGMSFVHVLDAHSEAMQRMLDTTNIVLESRRKAE